LSNENFKQYIIYITDFAGIINAGNSFIENLNKYIYTKNNVIINNDPGPDKRQQVLDLIETRVIEPALNCKTLPEDIKESVVRTLIKLETFNTITDIDSFFTGALKSPRGEEVYKALHNNHLSAFEDIRAEYNRIFQ